MHKFLRAIGFSDIRKKDLELILNEIIRKPDIIKVTKESEGNEFAELSKNYSSNMGITIRGIYNDDDSFDIEYYFPFFYGTNETNEDYIDIEKHSDREAYAGVCDDPNIGVTLIFYIQNVCDYLSERVLGNSYNRLNSVILSGLSTEGTILLPIKENKEKTRNVNSIDRSKLVSQAREGNEEAIESLTLDDIDTYSIISRRIVKEDIYSIVSSTFMPYGIESDQYSILGKILDFTKVQNSDTTDIVFCIKIECNDLIFDICINQNDLTGEPAIGRRFKGNVWMQGNICLG